jgi:hypothetical protein
LNHIPVTYIVISVSLEPSPLHGQIDMEEEKKEIDDEKKGKEKLKK